MKLTPSLYVKNLFAKLHPPIPPTKRESQQLLKLLDTSFRKQLNAEYPLPQTSKSPIQNGESQGEMGVGPVYATQQHLESILVHPLLQTTQQSRNATASWTKAAANQFDAALAGGCNVAAVGQVMAKYLNGLNKREIPDPQDRLGPRMTFWFSSLSMSEKLSFISNAKLISQAVPVMHADGMEEVVWEWLRILYEATAKHITPQGLAAEDTLVSLLMKMSIKDKSIQGAALQFVQACKYRVESGKAQTKFETLKEKPALRYQPLINSWKRLSFAILIRRFKHGVEADLFDEALSFCVPFSHNPTMPRSILAIFHPSTPSAEYLYRDIQSADFVDSFGKWVSSSESEMFKKALLVAVLDAAQLLLTRRKFEKAEQLLEFAEQQFPWILPDIQKDLDTADRLGYARQSLGPGLSFPFATT